MVRKVQFRTFVIGVRTITIGGGEGGSTELQRAEDLQPMSRVDGKLLGEDIKGRGLVKPT